MNREGSSRHVANRTEAQRVKRGSIVLRSHTLKGQGPNSVGTEFAYHVQCTGFDAQPHINLVWRGVPVTPVLGGWKARGPED